MAIARTSLLSVNPQVFDREAYDELARLFADVRQSLTDQEIALTDGSGDSGFLPLVGGTMTGEINMGSDKITNVVDPTSAQDAATKAYSDLKLPLAGGTMSGPIAMGTNKITGVVDPTAAQEAATKKYVDDNVVVNAETIAKAWFQWDMTSILDSFNVASVTDEGTGKLKPQWDTDFAGVNYAVICSTSNDGSASDIIWLETAADRTAAQCRLLTLKDGGGTFYDPNWVCAVAFGDQ